MLHVQWQRRWVTTTAAAAAALCWVFNSTHSRERDEGLNTRPAAVTQLLTCEQGSAHKQVQHTGGGGAELVSAYKLACRQWPCLCGFSQLRLAP